MKTAQLAAARPGRLLAVEKDERRAADLQATLRGLRVDGGGGDGRRRPRVCLPSTTAPSTPSCSTLRAPAWARWRRAPTCAGAATRRTSAGWPTCSCAAAPRRRPGAPRRRADLLRLHAHPRRDARRARRLPGRRELGPRRPRAPSSPSSSTQSAAAPCSPGRRATAPAASSSPACDARRERCAFGRHAPGKWPRAGTGPPVKEYGRHDR